VEVGQDGGYDLFRNRLFRHLDSDKSVFDIANRFGLQFDFVYSYLQEFENKGLIDSEPPAEISRKSTSDPSQSE
jgi:transposase